MEFHLQQLVKLCRICGGRLCKAKGRSSVYSCSDFMEGILMTFEVDVASDDKQVYPSKFCHPCYGVLARAAKARKEGLPYSHSTIPMTWESHSNNCPVCLHFEKIVRGGGQNRKEAKHKGRPRGETSKAVIKTIQMIAPPTNIPTEDPTPNYHISDAFIEELRCPICTLLLERPLELSCGAVVCMDCCCKWIQQNLSLSCPCCYDHLLNSAMIQPPSSLVLSLMDNLLIVCKRGCSKIVRAFQYKNHLAANCRDHYHQILNSPSKITIKDVLDKPTTSPATPAEIRATGHLVRRIIQQNACQSDKPVVVKIPTKGQPLTLMPVSGCRVPSAEACSKTLKRRSDEISRVRSIASGGDTTIQLEDEIQSLTKEERDKLLYQAQLPIVIPTDHALAMKADLGLPWNKLRILRRWLKSLNISVSSEKRQRAMASDIIGENLVAERGAFTFPRDKGGEEIRDVPFVYCPNIIAKVADVINQHERSPAGLTYHGGAIPEDELWIKLGGDKGQGSFKFSMQLMNVTSPNSMKKTALLSVFKAGDSTTNLHTALNMYREHIKETQGMKLNGRTIRVFLAGDYEFLCKMYGLSGASGRHNCLWCHITSSSLKQPLAERGRCKERTLSTLQEDHRSFLSQAGGNLKKAKEFNNVIGDIFFDIPLENVCIPGLHLSLGIFNRIWKLLEENCMELDIKVAEMSNGGSLFGGEKFREAVQQKLITISAVDSHKKYATVLDEMATYQCLTEPDPESSAFVQSLKKEAATTYKIIKDMSTELSELDAEIQKFKPNDGPFFSTLEKSLKKLNVARQAYQGGTFVGNHVHKLLQPKSIKILCVNIINASHNFSNLQEPAELVSTKFASLLSYYAKCHKGCNSSTFMDDGKIKELEKDIKTFMGYYRSTFPNASVLPKMHILEDHTIPWLQRWHLGAGLMGEQGAESLHAHLMRLERTYQGVANEVDRLKYIFKEHMLESAPPLSTLRPPLKKRKLDHSITT